MNKLLVTGSGGFIGQSFLPLVDNFDEIIRFKGDLRNINDVQQNVDKDIVAVVNLASKINGPEDEIRSINVDGLSNLLTVLIQKSPKLERFVHIGSAAEYGFADRDISELTKANPIGIYGLTKLEQSEMVINQFVNTNVSAVVLRLFNVVGKSMSKNMLFARIKDQIDSKDNDSILISNKRSIRDWVDVRDVVQLINRFTQLGNLVDSGIYNIGRGIAVTNEEVVIAFENYLGVKKSIVENTSDSDRSVADISKLKETIPSWKYNHDLMDMVKGMYE